MPIMRIFMQVCVIQTLTKAWYAECWQIPHRKFRIAFRADVGSGTKTKIADIMAPFHIFLWIRAGILKKFRLFGFDIRTGGGFVVGIVGKTVIIALYP